MALCKYDIVLVVLNIRAFFFLKAKFKELFHEAPYYREVHFLYILLFYLKCRVHLKYLSIQ